ncbi:MAG TPA: xanthine dehydrogenase family protein subunit M [Pyrinomonadaceae bacterium]|nr:xanthine dehydrogenase family protein subunit M [Pyrinomonadaceae bacterium]
MRAYLPAYELVSPQNLNEALTLLSDKPGRWRPFAGGTDLMVLLEAGKLPHKNYLNIWDLEELRGIDVTNEFITMGALTTYTDVQSNEILLKEFPMLCQAASETGGLAIQNRGTLGGNIVNASPAADSPPALLAYDAELELVSVAGKRWMPYHGFHTGYKQMTMRPDELLSRIRLPRNRYDTHYYRKVGTRKAQAISKVCFAATASGAAGRIEDVRLVLGSVAPVPLRCVKTEAALRGARIDEQTTSKALETLGAEITPIDDIRSTRSYRLKVSLNLLADFLHRLL